MKIKFIKSYLSNKVNDIVEVEDVDAKALVEGGKAEEVKETAEDLATKAAEALESHVEAQVKAEVSKQLAATFKNRKASITVHDNVQDDPKKGFKSFGDFGMAVIKAGNGGEHVLKAPSGMSVATDADGGYAVPQIWVNGIFTDIKDESDLFGRTQQYPMSVGDILHIPADNTTTLGSSGLVAAWTAEGNALSPQKAVLREVTLQPYKLGVLTAVTDELARDAQALDAYVNNKAAYTVKRVLNKAIVRGVGTTQPTGILNHASAVNVERHTANAVTYFDLAKMYGRFYGDMASAVWLVNYEAFPYFVNMTSGNSNMFVPAGGATGSLFNTAFGAPIIRTDLTPALGTQGDVILTDLKQYLTAYKGGVEAAESMHLYFDKVEKALRWVFRVDGKPARAAAITPENGTRTLSPIVQLDDAVATGE